MNPSTRVERPEITPSITSRGPLGRTLALALLLVTTVLSALAGAPSTQAIVGGHDSAAPYSFMGSLQLLDGPRDDLHVCGVSLIAPRWAITAGHCTRTAADVIDQPTTGHPTKWKVRFGSTQVDSGGDLVKVKRFVQLNNRYFVDDLALLRLARPVDAVPIAIAAASPAVGTETRILGWGQTCHDSTAKKCSPKTLQEADVAITGVRTCDPPKGTFCVGSQNGKVGPENMDSGGPAVVMIEGQWTLVGTVEGGGAGRATASVYTDVAKYQDWIQGLVSGDVPIGANTPFPSHALRGTAIVNGCSGSVIRSPLSRASDDAMLLTNGHCVYPGRPRPGQVVQGRRDHQLVRIKNAHGDTIVRAYTKRLVYATMTDTDVAVYRLDHTYAQLRASKVKAFSLAATGPRPGQKVKVLSAGSGQDWTCTIARIVPGLREAGYNQKHSIRYRTQRGCNEALGDGPSHGDSGSPLLDAKTGKIVGIHNTGNDGGRPCTENNPCEIDAQGRKTSVKNARYGQQTATLRKCLAAGSRIALNRPECSLPK